MACYGFFFIFFWLWSWINDYECMLKMGLKMWISGEWVGNGEWDNCGNGSTNWAGEDDGDDDDEW